MPAERRNPAAEPGVEIEADSLEELFAEAARALCDSLTEAEEVMPHESRVLELEAEDPDLLLLAWLRELLLVFETEGLLFNLAQVNFEVSAPSGAALEGRLWGEPYDPERHPLRHPAERVAPERPEILRDGGRWRTRLVGSG